MRSVFGAEFGQGWLYEMRLGLDGVITGNAMYADLMARIWDLHVRGRQEEVRDAYSKFLLMRNLNQQIPGADLYIMKKRGVFKTTVTRRSADGSPATPSDLHLSPDAATRSISHLAEQKSYLLC
jgi:hypothetical protein